MNPPETSEAYRLIFQIVEGMRNTHLRDIPHSGPPDVSISQLRVMGCIIFNDGKQMKLKDIADELAITPGGVSQMVESLVKAGVLERVPDKDDRRAVNITLSKRGRETMREADLYFSDLSRELLSPVPPEKQKIFLEVLETMVETLTEMKNKRRNRDDV